MQEDYMKNDYTQTESPVEEETVSDEKTEQEYRVIYCGPNIPYAGLFTYQVFLGGLPFSVREIIQEIPEIEKLLVPVSELEATRRKIREKGSLEYTYNERIRGKVRQ